MVTLENLAGVIVVQGGGGGAGNVEKKIHADGEIGGVEEPGSVLLDQISDAVEFVVPARGADDHVLAAPWCRLRCWRARSEAW